ncbi:hypothetical protein [Escherichia coli]
MTGYVDQWVNTLTPQSHDIR